MYDKTDSEKYTHKSGKKIKWKCKICGYVFERRVCDVVNRGVSCPCCSIKISYPNRFMAEVLNQIGIDFEREKIFDWSDNKRYDFFIEPNTIIEVHGSQHYERAYSFGELSLDDVKRNDEIKHKMALKNGIDNYYVINAKKSDDVWLKNSIIKELSGVFDLKIVDWKNVSNQASKNLTELCLNYWNSGLNVPQISKKMKIDAGVIRDKLKFLTELNCCDYDPIESLKEVQRVLSHNNKKKIYCLSTGIHFESINDAATFYDISPKSISNCLNGLSETTHYKRENKYLKWRYY